MIDLLLLGTGAMVPLPDRWLSSILVRVEGSLVLIDCGEGTQIAMREHGWGFKRLDAIVLTHHHADHVAGIPGLFHSLANAGRTETIDVYGPPGTVAIVQALRIIAAELPYPIRVHDVVSGETFPITGGLVASTTWAEHRVPCLAWRFDLPRKPAFDVVAAESLSVPRDRWSELQRGESVHVEGRIVTPDQVLTIARSGISFGIATDTRPTPGIVELMTGVDLLISEATYATDDYLPQAIEHKHMTFREAASMAREANAKHLWLTHFSARIADPAEYRDLAAEHFLNVEIGHAGLTGTIRFDRGYQSAS
jgi:ribonuclease Z